MDAQNLMLGLAVGAAAGFAHVASLAGSVALARAGRALSFATLQLARLAGVALVLVATARRGPATLEAAAAALIAARSLAIRLRRSAA